MVYKILYVIRYFIVTKDVVKIRLFCDMPLFPFFYLFLLA